MLFVFAVLKDAVGLFPADPQAGRLVALERATVWRLARSAAEAVAPVAPLFVGLCAAEIVAGILKGRAGLQYSAQRAAAKIRRNRRRQRFSVAPTPPHSADGSCACGPPSWRLLRSEDRLTNRPAPTVFALSIRLHKFSRYNFSFAPQRLRHLARIRATHRRLFASHTCGEFVKRLKRAASALERGSAHQ